MTSLRFRTALLVVAVTATAGCGGSDSSSTPAADGLRVVVLGDSIATGSEGGSGTSYGAVYADLLEQQTGQQVELTNLADPSETSATLLTALGSPELKEAVASSDIVVITVGGNDGDPFATYEPGVCAAGGDPAACIGAYAPDQEANLDAIIGAVEELRAGQPTAIRLTSPDYNPFVGVDEIADVPPFPKEFGLTFFRQVAEAENDNACRVAEAHDAGCADFLHVFNGAQGDQPATAYLGADHLHPSEAGQQAIAKALLGTGLAPLSYVRSTPPVSGSAHVGAPHVAPRGDREDHDDQRTVDRDVGRGRVEPARAGLGERHQREPEQLPGRLEEQHGQEPDRVPQPEEGQQRHGGEEAQGHALVEGEGVRVGQERPLHEDESDPHEEVAGPHEVQSDHRQLGRRPRRGRRCRGGDGHGLLLGW